MPTGSATSNIGPKDGAKRTGLWPCVTRRDPGRRRLKSRSSTNSSRRRSTAIVFVTNMKRPIDLLAWFYSQRGGAENLIKEANNDAGLAAHPSGRWTMNCNHFQLAMLAMWVLSTSSFNNTEKSIMLHTQEVTGSSPVAPTISPNRFNI